MKRVLQFGIAALALSQVVAHAGIGSALIQNNNGGTVIPIFNVDGTTKLTTSDFKVGVFVNNNGSLGAQVGGFVSPGSSGRFSTSPGQQDIPGSVAGSTISLIVIAWDVRSGADFASATIKGQSAPFTTPALGGDADNDPTSPALTAPSMAANFKSFALVPEPSTVALAALGLGGLLFISRRK